MPSFEDEAIILNTKPFGENDSLIHVMTKENGKAAGIIRGGQSGKYKNQLQPGSKVMVEWYARLESQLGHFKIESLESIALDILLEQGRLCCLSSALALVQNVMGEHESHPAAYHDLCALILALDSPIWAQTYCKWEIALLNEIGFGLDLSRCAATGKAADEVQLSYVSPKSGRAVSHDAGTPYHDKMLPLPAFLQIDYQPSPSDQEIFPHDILDALKMSGYFLTHGPLAHTQYGLPSARQRLSDFFVKQHDHHS